jgi:hypothetical protein
MSNKITTPPRVSYNNNKLSELKSRVAELQQREVEWYNMCKRRDEEYRILRAKHYLLQREFNACTDKLAEYQANRVSGARRFFRRFWRK